MGAQNPAKMDDGMREKLSKDSSNSVKVVLGLQKLQLAKHEETSSDPLKDPSSAFQSARTLQ